MKKEQFLDIMNEIDDELISGAIMYTKKKQSRGILKIAAVAACLCLMLGAFFAVPLLNKKEVKTPDIVTEGKDIPETTDDSQGKTENIPSQIISALEVEKAEGVYAAPEAGQVGYTVAVGEAFNEYHNEEVCFLLAFDVFKEHESLSGEELTKEYQRLSDLGYKLYLMENHWTYHGEGERLYVPIVVALVTEDEVSNFKVNENYGYFFYFVKNGDGSPISFEGAEAITDFHIPYV